ncbi:hypothetical protein Glove_297g27 [Diversispora epigaea]|uniref:Uncharacterized protein n=1 Tax=Diversispora epigaea TaxID=1348612 RepID=A0A397HXS8_9GLOM|nr:hypothetical protein Glove_297g27 [Diversispora epigaea]
MILNLGLVNEFSLYYYVCIKVRELTRFPLSIKLVQSGHFLAITQQDIRELTRFPLSIKLVQSGHFLAITQQDKNVKTRFNFDLMKAADEFDHKTRKSSNVIITKYTNLIFDALLFKNPLCMDSLLKQDVLRLEAIKRFMASIILPPRTILVQELVAFKGILGEYNPLAWNTNTVCSGDTCHNHLQELQPVATNYAIRKNELQHFFELRQISLIYYYSWWTDGQFYSRMFDPVPQITRKW